MKQPKSKYDRFVERLGPGLYRRLQLAGVKNVDTAWDHMMRQLAFESSYGDSTVARNQHNYGGYGWNGSTYTTFENDDAFLDAYVKLMNRRYRDAVNSTNIQDYARNLKKMGYFEDDLTHYSGLLAGMNTISRAAAAHKAANPGLYSFTAPYKLTPEEAKLGIPNINASKRIAIPPSVQLQTPTLTAPTITVPELTPIQPNRDNTRRNGLFLSMMLLVGLNDIF